MAANKEKTKNTFCDGSGSNVQIRFTMLHLSKKGDHIHHLDGNPSNNNIDNLALLCFEHHNMASVTGNLSKKLSRLTILNYREHHYKVIELARQRQLGIFDKPVETLTEEKILVIAKNAKYYMIEN